MIPNEAFFVVGLRAKKHLLFEKRGLDSVPVLTNYWDKARHK